MNVGVLALQGASRPHVAAFARLGVVAREVRRRDDLVDLTHLVIPGGESTTIRHLLDLFELSDALVARAREGSLAIFGTCAGAILLGRDEGERPRRFGLLDVAFERNGYGTQVDSFAGPIDLAPSLGGGTFPGVFIRAPRIRDVGRGVEVLATRNGEPVMVRQGALLAATFHPELAGALRIHENFIAPREARESARSVQA